MRDFPPDIRAYTETGREGDEPDTRSPRAFLRWMIARQGSLFWFGLLVALVWMVPQTLGPWIVGRAIDTGIVGGDPSATAKWVAVLAVVTVAGALSGIVFHTVIVREWLIALYGTTMLVTRKALRLGHVLTRRTPTGEVLSVSGSDGDQFGALMEVTTRALSQLAAYLVVAGIVLTTSVRMGLLVLVSAPLLVLLGAPLLRPMQRWQGGRACAQLRADVDGHRHRGRSAHPAGHRRRADVRRQLRRPVAAGASSRRLGRALALGRRVGRRAALGRLRRRAAVARHP